MLLKRVVLWVAAAFVAAQLLALGLASQFLKAPDAYQILENPADPANAVYLLAYVIASAAVLLLLLKYYRGKLLFTLIEFLLVLFTLQVALELFIPTLAAIAIAFVLALARFKFPHLRTALLIVATSVVAALIGVWIDLLPAALLALLLSAYDVIAVFYTKHMITLAKGLEGRAASFSISFALGDRKKIASAKRRLKPANETPPSEAEWSGEFIELGTGDIVMPAMLACAALKVSPLLSAAALVGGVIGLFLLFHLLERRRGYWPALPPIVACTLAAIGIAYVAQLIF